MNFLAHSFLGFNNPELIAGQFCGDFVRGSDLSRFPDQIEKGIRLHRHLDSFSDNHASLASVRQSIKEVPRRLTGIILDVMFDHYLAGRWQSVSQLSLDEHAALVQLALTDHQTHFPPELIRFMSLLERERILQNNIHLSAIEKTLARIASRSSIFARLALTTEQLEPLRDTLIEPFDEFLPELRQAAEKYIAQ